MKIRASFVSNSSSASFVLDPKKLTPDQIDMIRYHITVAEQNFPSLLQIGEMCRLTAQDAWIVEDLDDTLVVRTDMDNFDMHEFLRLIEVPRAAILHVDDENRFWFQ